MADRTYTYLALGDSYTIGEGVLIQDNFPFQASEILRSGGINFAPPEIIATTGWTTGELKNGIAAATLRPGGYDLVTLLIGVNNQYRGKELAEYSEEFEGLLRQAVGFARNAASHTFILSIPDWSVTPFAGANLPDKHGRDMDSIAREIDAFNDSAKKIAARYQVNFIDITTHTRSHGHSASPGPHTSPSPARSLRPGVASPWFAPDGLHPSGQEYAHWAGLLAAAIRKKI